MSSAQRNSNVIIDFENYLKRLNITPHHKIINQFLNSLSSYLVNCKQILMQVDQLEHSYSPEIQERLIQETDGFLLVAKKLEDVVPFDAKIKIRDCFRSIIGDYLFQSKILERFYEKPRGYAGDYMMFEMMYDAKPLSQDLGIYFDNYVFCHPIVTSVVNRKEKMKKVLVELLTTEIITDRPIKLLNIGCGGAREVRELFSKDNFSRNIDFSFMDQDREGLDYARKNLEPLQKGNLKFNFIHKEAREMIGLSQKPVTKKSYDVIYSLGIVDYFLDNVFCRFIKHCYDMLNPKGRLIIAACSNRDMSIYIALRWLCEWNFYYRDVSQVKHLINETIEKPNLTINWEKKEHIFFIDICKNK